MSGDSGSQKWAKEGIGDGKVKTAGVERPFQESL